MSVCACSAADFRVGLLGAAGHADEDEVPAADTVLPPLPRRGDREEFAALQGVAGVRRGGEVEFGTPVVLVGNHARIQAGVPHNVGEFVDAVHSQLLVFGRGGVRVRPTGEDDFPPVPPRTRSVADRPARDDDATFGRVHLKHRHVGCLPAQQEDLRVGSAAQCAGPPIPSRLVILRRAPGVPEADRENHQDENGHTNGCHSEPFAKEDQRGRADDRRDQNDREGDRSLQVVH